MTAKATDLGRRVAKRLVAGLMGFTMVELAVVLVIVSGFVLVFSGQASDLRQSRAAQDVAAQGRIDTIANAIYTAWRPGVSVLDLDEQTLADYTNASVVFGPLPYLAGGAGQADGVLDRSLVSVAFATPATQAEEATPGGYFGLATIGRDGSCWLMRGRVGLVGVADLSLQTANYFYLDLPENEPSMLQAACTGASALVEATGGASWQNFTVLDQ